MSNSASRDAVAATVALYGGIETGGTTTACVIGTGPDDLVAEARFATTTPAETIGRIVGFFREHARAFPVAAVGVGSFGPVDLDRKSPTHGYITTTPKPGWQQIDLCGPLADALRVPLAFDTDVNAAALGEYRWGAGSPTGARGEGDAAPEVPGAERPLDPLLYLTVGTGIGLGAIVHGSPLHGLIHPEAGHMLLPHDRALDPFDGACPFHGDCWEGLASGSAIEKRWGQSGETLPPDHAAWTLEAHYLGVGIANLLYCFSPRRVVVGGGVLKQPGLLDRVRRGTQNAIGGYLRSDALAGDIDKLIVPPRLGARAGVLGALALAALAPAIDH
jgi:fructokinase